MSEKHFQQTHKLTSECIARCRSQWFETLKGQHDGKERVEAKKELGTRIACSFALHITRSESAIGLPVSSGMFQAQE